jgi:hypothetical protein
MVLATAACGGSNSSAAEQPSPAPQATAEEESAYPGSSLTGDVVKAPVGASVTLTGAGFPANAQVTLTWKTFDGRYLLEQEEVVFVGPRYDARLVELASVTTDSAGAFHTGFSVLEDFGGSHDIVARVDGKFATKMGFTVQPSFSVSAMSGPVGMPLDITATGLGYRAQEGLWEVSWDNGFTGYMTAVTTHGTALAQIRIAGPPGPHVLKIWRNFRGIPYLNPHQGPFGPLPEPTTFVINVTDGHYEAPAVWANPDPQLTVRPTPDAKSQGGATLTVTPDRGTVGSELTLTGTGFPANQPVALTWATRTGQKITDTGLMEGFDERLSDLPAATAGADGRFELKLTVPDDYAGYHRITAAGGEVLAEAYYSIYASIIEFTERAKVGEDISIHMKGVGWTIQGKTYAVVYDNAYLGYGCSFSTSGDIDLHLPAAGTPGLHIIDLYPAVYEGQDPTPNIYSRPNLTYLEDHPGGTLPAFRLTIEIID